MALLYHLSASFVLKLQESRNGAAWREHWLYVVNLVDWLIKKHKILAFAKLQACGEVSVLIILLWLVISLSFATHILYSTSSIKLVFFNENNLYITNKLK